MKKEQDEIPSGNISIYRKLHKAKQSIGKVLKSSTAKIPTKNGTMNLIYLDINDLLDAVEPILHENGLIILQPIISNGVMTQIIDIDSGDMIESYLQLPVNVQPKDMGSAITYFRRYTLQSALSIKATDDDADAATKSTIQYKKPEVSNDMVNKFLESVKAGVNKWPVQKFMDSYELTTAQKDILILHQL
jgi:hypothetical protein